MAETKIPSDNAALEALPALHPTIRRLIAHICDQEQANKDLHGICKVYEIRIREQDKAIAEAREALEFYGSPMTYFAIGIFPDQPCGPFIEDYDEAEREVDGLVKPFPGKKARDWLKRYGEGD